MSYTVLARRYRSQNFDDIVGQEHISQTLKKAIESGRISHAYLFCGTRGTGKTSTARILAKALNCSEFDKPTPTPCGKCDSCQAIARGDDIDVIEIDAASNTGVDNVREIIENSQYRPARSRFKVYIIDEVHMLSKSAFNALLKTLEEPPSHVKFILATTEPEKVLPTILSRCQRYDFRNIASKQIAGHLKEICKKEKIKADDDALASIARAGAGSMRDSLSLLDRLMSMGEKHLTLDDIEKLLGLPPIERVAKLVGSIGSGDVKAVLTQTESIVQSGLSTDALLGAMVDYFRNLLIARMCGAESALLDIPGQTSDEFAAQSKQFDPTILTQDIVILEELRRNLRHNQTGRALLDATLVRLTLADQFASIGDLLSGGGISARPSPAPAQKKNPEPVTQNPPPAQRQNAERPTAQHPPVDSHSPEPESQPEPVAPIPQTGPIWPRLLEHLRRQGLSVNGSLALARLERVESASAVIRFAPAGTSFARVWSSTEKKNAINRALSELHGRPIVVSLEVDELPADAPTPESTALEIESSPMVQAVRRVFGDVVVMDQ